ncbi:LAQU0S19e00210g1_1 [Lachancea quebecensis]|uniref:LAQU0S19e00210g1_1 n=1 Tax=Lachancea quebecensis TaxID=1654605 RepID=A0A0P1L4H9_9SACH|nr:LAQU0S19e00210g1_1 [Lachancea quebecensis]
MSDLSFTPKVEKMLDFDKKHLWHPYTSMSNPLKVYPVKSAAGATITLDTKGPEETTLVEAMSSWWCMIHGYNNPEINAAIIEQVGKMSHVMFGGLTHQPAVSAAEKLLQLIDHEKLKFCFLADSGSVAVEVAMKMALQYEFTKNGDKTNKSKFLTLRNGYHGDTFGAMSVCDPVNSMHSLYRGYLPQNIFVSAPSVIDTLPTSTIFNSNPEIFEGKIDWNKDEIIEFEEAIRARHVEICAVILEPILQGAGGMRLYHPQYLIEVRKLCTKYKVPLIMDEIATGFCRTGTMFAFHHCRKYQKMLNIPPENQVDVYPDILCVGKALTGGYLTLSAVVTTSEIKDVISRRYSVTGGCFMHGPTFMGNPLACKAAEKSLEILLRGDCYKQVASIEAQLMKQMYLPLLSDQSLMKTVIKHMRIIGAVGVIELRHAVDSAWFHDRFISMRVYVRPFGKLLYIMPPYVIKEAELSKVIEAIKQILQEWKSHLGITTKLS